MENKNNIPDFQSIMLPMLKLLGHGEPMSLNEVVKDLAEQFGLGKEDMKIKVPSGQMGLFRNRVGWTRSYLKNAGLIYYPKRAFYQITPYGLEYLKTNPNDLRIKHLKEMPKYIEWTKTFNQGQQSTETDAIKDTEKETPEEILANTVEQLNKQLAIDLLDKLKENSFEFFENFVISLLHKMGYGDFREEAAVHTGKTGDNGVDGIIAQDRLGLENVYVQAKRFNDQNPVGSGDIRNFIGSLAVQGVNKGVFLTTSRFSSSAIKTAQDSKQQKIILVDGKKLSDLAIEFSVGVQIDDNIEIKKIDLDFFEE